MLKTRTQKLNIDAWIWMLFSLLLNLYLLFLGYAGLESGIAILIVQLSFVILFLLIFLAQSLVILAILRVALFGLKRGFREALIIRKEPKQPNQTIQDWRVDLAINFVVLILVVITFLTCQFTVN